VLRPSRFPLGLAATAGIALVAAGAVLADNPNKVKIARTAAGNAQARGEVLRRSDLGKGWFGGFTKPDLVGLQGCSYRPKQSDLVVIGAAETAWDKPTTYEFDSEAEVLKTAAMVGRDWRRSVIAPQVLPCLRKVFKKAVEPGGKVVSVRRVTFPPVASLTRAFRFVAKFAEGRFESDFVAMASGRNELALTLVSSGGKVTWLRAQELRLARLLAHRMHS